MTGVGQLEQRQQLGYHLVGCRRVDACVILGKTYSEVAEAEGVDESAVRRAVERGLENMKKYLKKSR